jgi:hypothetical protein
LTSHKYHLVPGGTAAARPIPVWTGDGSRVIVRDTRGISIVRTDTGARHPLISVRGYAIGRSVGVSRDGRWITYTETGTEEDIWLATLSDK